MARHAGFAVAVSVGEAFINQSLSAAIADISPLGDSQLFTVPSSVPVIGGDTARLSGIGLFEQRPQVQLRANPGNTVAMSASAIVFLTGTTNSTLPFASISDTWKVRLTGTANVGIDVDVAPDGLFVRWVPGVSSIGSLTITVLNGPPPPSWLMSALNSQPMRQAMSFAISQLRPIRVTPKLLDRTVRHVQKGEFRSTGVSLFEWFVISETVNRAVVRILDGSVAIGIDFQGRTNGNPAQLVDLRHQPGDAVAYRWLVRDNTLPTDRPLLVAKPLPDDRDIAVLFNADVLSAIVAGVSAQITGTPIAPGVRISSIAIRPERFDKPLRGPEMGLRVDVTVNHNIAGDVRLTAFLQAYLQEDGRGLANQFAPFWLLYAGHIVVDVPWWVDIAVVVLGLALAAVFPALTPLLIIGVIAAIDGIIPGAIDSATGAAIQTQGRGTVLVQASKASTLATQKHQSSWEMAWIAVSTEGVDLRMSIVAADVRFGTLDDTVDVAKMTCLFDANHKGPYQVTLDLRPDLQFLAASCAVQIVVTRSSTGAEVLRAEGPWAANRAVGFSHLTSDLYFEDEFTVHVRIWLNSTSLTGLLFSADADVPVTDGLDRHRPFVTWPEHEVRFRNPGTKFNWWARISHPKIHRTATSARCAAVRRAASRRQPPGFSPWITYIDELPFEWSEIPANRSELCDHCFFDTPHSTVVSPRVDWFTNRFRWPMQSAPVQPPDDTGHTVALGPPNGLTWAVLPGNAARFGGVIRQPCLDLAELLRPSAITAGDIPDWRALARTHAVAFERNGNAPAAGGGWESCSFTFSDGSNTFTVNWDERAGAARDPRVVANGSLRGADYVSTFGMVPASPEAQIGPDEVISFLLFDLSGLTFNADRPGLRVTVSGFVPGPGAEATPDLDAIAFLFSQT